MSPKRWIRHLYILAWIAGTASPSVAGDETIVTSSVGVVSTCRQITTSSFFEGDDNDDASTRVEFNTTVAWPGTIACDTVTGSSPRQCLMTGLTPGSSYYLRITFTDPDGVSGWNPEVVGPLDLPACGSDQAAPTLLVLGPRRDAVVGGAETVKVQAFDAEGVSGVEVAVDGGASSPATVSAAYDCGPGCEVYEWALDTVALGNGPHDLTVLATDASGNTARLDSSFRVNNAGTSPAGGGTLLRRTYGAQLCLDCHNLATHSSQWTGTTKGNWALDCLVCHTPHRTRNVHLIRETVRTPSSGFATVNFRQDDIAGGTNPADAFLGDTSGAGNTPYDDGICEICHTRTNHYRNDASGGDHAHNSGVRCVLCHPHQKGFLGGGGGPAHLTHTIEEYGPKMTCESGNLGCHGSQSPPVLADGLALAATTVCDTCHSPGGFYNGVDSTGDSVGAKDNWPDGVYEGGALAAGKEKWCVGCHDDAPSVVLGVTAPNVAGNEAETYTYGTGWGYYKTGHGLASDQSYPASGGTVAGAGVGCDGCHEPTTAHVDGVARTYGFPGTPASYQSGYRLKSVGGEIPLEVPRDNYCPGDGELYTNQLLVDPVEFRLCFSCHLTAPFTDSANANTNFRNGTLNAHYSHLAVLETCGPGPVYRSDWDSSHDADSRATCMSCHNVHGSTRFSMVRDGRLLGKEPGLEVAYYNSGVSYQCGGPGAHPPTPADVELPDSTGTVWNPNVGHLCNACHGGCGWNLLYLRDPFDSSPPPGDVTPPAISAQSPADGETPVVVDRNVTFTLADAEAGVDWMTFSIQLTGDKGYARTYTYSDLAVVTKVGTPASYDVVVDPDVDFALAEAITVTVNVDDLAGNSMIPAVWSFTTTAGGASETLRLHPSDVAASGGFSVTGGTWADVLDSQDADLSYAYFCCSSSGQTFYVDLDDSGLGAVAVESVTVYVYARYVDGPWPGPSPYAGNVSIGYRTGTATVWETGFSTDTSGGYNLLQSAIYTTDSDGGGLDVTDIDNLQVAVRRNASGSVQLRVTEVYVEVTYLP